MLTSYAKRAPLGRTVTTDEVGNVAAFLCSDLASGITGEITCYVDGGFNTSALSIRRIFRILVKPEAPRFFKSTSQTFSYFLINQRLQFCLGNVLNEIRHLDNHRPFELISSSVGMFI